MDAPNAPANTPLELNYTPVGSDSNCTCTAHSSPSSQPRLLDQVRRQMGVRHYSIRTEEQYLLRVRKFVLFHEKRHSREMGASEVEAFQTHLAVEQHVVAATQNQALSGILFLYRHRLNRELPGWTTWCERNGRFACPWC